MFKRMYLSPIRSVAENFLPKLAIGIAALPFVAWFPEAAEEALFTIPPGLLVIVIGLWLLDFLSGIVKALRDGGLSDIRSYKLRQTVIKLIEYAIFILALDLFSSTAKYAGLIAGILRQVDNLGCIILAATEFKSIDENLRWELLEKMKAYADFRGLFGKKAQEEESERRN